MNNVLTTIARYINIFEPCCNTHDLVSNHVVLLIFKPHSRIATLPSELACSPNAMLMSKNSLGIRKEFKKQVAIRTQIPSLQLWLAVELYFTTTPKQNGAPANDYPSFFLHSIY